MDLVGIAEAAQILGWEKSTVSDHYKSGKLPVPLAQLASGPIWHRQSITAYANSTGSSSASQKPRLVKRVTLKDVAKEAGVAPITASRALSGKDPGKVGEAKRSKILEVAHTLGYRPHNPARALRTRSTLQFGLVVPRIDRSFTASVVEGLQDVAIEEDYSCLLYITQNQPSVEELAFQALIAKRVDGVIWVPGPESLRNVDLLREQEIPILQLLSNPHSDLPSVVVDHKAGERTAIQYLHSLGHRRIAFLARSGPHSQLRLAGYQEAVRDLLLDDDPALTVDFGDDWLEGLTKVRRLLNSAKPPTAIATPTDPIAWAVLRAAREVGVKVPDQLAVIGFDDIPQAQLFSPPLTTMAQPKRKLGRRAMSTLIKIMQGAQGENVVMQASLVVRSSTGPLSPQ